MKFLQTQLSLSFTVMIVTVLAVFAIAARPPLDTDTYWHLRAGAWQVEHQQVLGHDEFSSTRPGEAWINIHWLTQIIMFVLFDRLGELGLILFTGLLAAGGMALVYRICGGDAILRASVTILAALSAAIFWSARPQMVSFFFSAVVWFLLWRSQRQGAGGLWFIPVLMMIWANMHPGFAIGFVLLALATLGEAAQWLLAVLRRDQEASFRPVIRLIAIGVVSAAATLINPFGIDALLLPFRTIGFSVLREYIQEWAAPNFHQPQTWPFMLMLVGTLIAAGMSSRKLEIRDAVMLGGNAMLALLAARNIPTLALVAAPILAEHLDTLLVDMGLRLNADRLPATGFRSLVNALLILLIGFGVGARVWSSLQPAAAAALPLPANAIKVMRDQPTPPQMFNSYNWGGYLMWVLPNTPVFVDGRTDLYDGAVLQAYVTTYFAEPGWDRVMDDYKINTVLIEPASPLAKVLRLTEGWKIVYEDKIAILFVRKTPIDG
jgi:hypothetical protein